MSTTTKPEQELDTLQARHAELSAQLARLDREIEAERDAMGQAVAAGKDGAAHRTRARDVGESAEGIRRALPLIECDMEALRTRITAERLSSAREAYQQAAKAAAAGVAGVDKALRQFHAGDLAKLRTEMMAALETERTASGEYDSTASALGEYQATTRPGAFDKHRGLPLLLQILDQYAKDGAVYPGNAFSRSLGEEPTKRSLAFS